MKIYRYTVIFEPLKEGGYNAIFPAIPEICTFGETLEKATTHRFFPQSQSKPLNEAWLYPSA